MKVSELIAKLQQCDPDSEVTVAQYPRSPGHQGELAVYEFEAVGTLAPVDHDATPPTVYLLGVEHLGYGTRAT